MEHNAFVLSGLKRKRDELLRDLRTAEKTIALIHTRTAALDATLRLFDPEARLAAIGSNAGRAGRRTGLAIAIRTALREAEAPVTGRQIAEAIAVKIKVNTRSQKEVAAFVNRVRGSLRHMNGLVGEQRVEGTYWRVG